MKISILTFSHAENYGAVLQAYALKSYLIKQGHDVSFVFPTINKPKFKDYLLRPFASFHKALTRLNRQSLSVKSEYKDDQNSDNLKKSFRAFQAKTLKLDPDYNAATIRANSDYCVDLFIVGSDQVWAIDPVFYGANFLLDFVDDEVAKISYAASFGRSNLERYQFSTYRLFLNRFRGLSVREPTGVKIIENLGIKGAVTVCDPQFLSMIIVTLLN